MTERGLYLDLARMVDDSIRRALQLNRSWSLDHVYICKREHRMHTVCSTLEAIGYMTRRFEVGEKSDESAWSFTEQGVELYEELRQRWRFGRKHGLD